MCAAVAAAPCCFDAIEHYWASAEHATRQPNKSAICGLIFLRKMFSPDKKRLL